MIGAAVYDLVAVRGGKLPVFNGGLMHGAFFSAVASLSPRYAAFLHDAAQIKPFTVSSLALSLPTPRNRTKILLEPGRTAKWRVTGLNDEILSLMAAIVPGVRLTVGDTEWRVESLALGPDEDRRAGAVTEEQLIGETFRAVPRRITLRFLSPASFRVYDRDFPWPQPELIFGSLADRWLASDFSARPDAAAVRRAACALRPVSWRGQSQKIYFGSSHGVTGFIGEYAYDLSNLPPDERCILLLLARYAEFSGVGRLTAQGLGQTETEYQ